MILSINLEKNYFETLVFKAKKVKSYTFVKSLKYSKELIKILKLFSLNIKNSNKLERKIHL